MRRGLGLVLRVLLLLAGTVLLLAGAAASVLIGPDNTAQTGPHRLATEGVAILSTAEALHYVGPTLHLQVADSDGDPIFVGIANEVDARSYVGDGSRLEISRLRLPWTPTTDEPGESDAALAAPADQPWWLLSEEGEGARELVWPIPHGRYAIVALNSDGEPTVNLDVTLGLELEGAFYAALAVTAFGLALVLLGVWLTLRRRRRRRRRAAAETELSSSEGVS